MTNTLDPTFDPAFESELSSLLHEHGASVTVAADPVGLSAALGRADRLRAIGRASVVAAVAGCVLAGSLLLRDGTTGESLELSPAESGPSDPRVALSVEELDDLEDRAEPVVTSTVTSVVTAPPSTAVEAALAAAPTTSSSSTTTVVPTTAAPVATTVAPSTTQAPTVGFSAVSLYGSCSEDPPYDEYSGTANPGSTVTITSPWSSPVSVTADQHGHWTTTVTFPSAPVNESFTVTVSSPQGTQQLPFVRTG